VHLAAKAGRPLVEYMLRRAIGRHDLSTVEGQSVAVASVMPILQRLTDPVRRSEYGHLVADLAGVAERSVLATMDRHGVGAGPADVAKATKRGSASERVEREMLKLLVRDAGIYQGFAQKLNEDHFRSPAARSAFIAIRGAGGDVGPLAGGPDERLAATVSALVVEPLDGEPTAEYAEHVWTRLQEFLLKRRSDELRMRLQKLNPTIEPGYDAMFNELVAIDGELRRLRHGERDAV
jgi:DNA primase